MKESEISRFYEKIEFIPFHECWEWIGKKQSDGYGEFRALGKVYFRAHRFSWILFYGNIPDGVLVCHKCDNRGCVNPNHLFLGSRLDNTMDMDNKGRRVNYNSFKEKCPMGHTYTIYSWGRRCKICNTIAARRYRKSKLLTKALDLKNN